MMDMPDGRLATFWNMISTTGTANVELRPSPGPGLRHFVSTVVIDNMGLTQVRVFIRSGSMNLFSATVPGLSTLVVPCTPPAPCGYGEAVNVAMAAVGNISVSVLGYVDA